MKTARLFTAVLLALSLASCKENSSNHANNNKMPEKAISQKSVSEDEKRAMFEKISDRMGGVEIDKFKSSQFWNSRPGDKEYRDPYTYFYLSSPSDKLSPKARLVIAYIGDRWVFFDRVQILADDDLVFDQRYNREEVSRDNGSSFVMEVVDMPVSEDLAKTAARIGAAKSATVRFSGDRTKDYSMSKGEIENFAKLAEVFDDIRPLYGLEKLGLPRNSKGNDIYWKWYSSNYEKKSAAIKDAKRMEAEGVKVSIHSYTYTHYLTGPIREGRTAALKDKDLAESLGLEKSFVAKASASTEKK